jgi:AcrR family transcriptional regulator
LVPYHTALGAVSAMVRVMSRTARHDLSSAALDLFLAHGYDRTTADDIAEAAGVARRTFFRHFRTKEDAVFPDHEECLRHVEDQLAHADPGRPPLDVLGDAAHLVLAMYAADAPASVRRYQLVREVQTLRDRELVTTSRYQRVFADYLNQRLPGRDGDRLVHELAATAVVATHNFVLRQWLRDGGTGDVHRRFDTALRSLAGKLPAWLRAQSGTPEPPGDGEVVVLMIKPDTPMWRIVEEIKKARS